MNEHDQRIKELERKLYLAECANDLLESKVAKLESQNCVYLGMLEAQKTQEDLRETLYPIHDLAEEAARAADRVESTTDYLFSKDLSSELLDYLHRQAEHLLSLVRDIESRCGEGVPGDLL